MSPTATLMRALEAMLAMDGGNEDARAEAADALRELAEWLVRGGFRPDVAEVCERIQRMLDNNTEEDRILGIHQS